MLEQFAVFNHQVEPRDVHVHHASGANVQVPYFAVAHLPVGSPTKRPLVCTSVLGNSRSNLSYVGLRASEIAFDFEGGA